MRSNDLLVSDRKVEQGRNTNRNSLVVMTLFFPDTRLPHLVSQKQRNRIEMKSVLVCCESFMQSAPRNVLVVNLRFRV
jgi:hypothetical protein